MSTNGYGGTQGPNTRVNQFNAVTFVVEEILSVRNHTALVKVVAVRSAGEVAEVGFVDVQIMINQIDGDGKAWPHVTVNNVPYMRLQGGANAIIIDPQVNDIGMCVFADRDISAVKATRAVANPGSMRRADIADGLYVGGFLNAAPQQYMRFTTAGIEIVSPTQIKLSSPDIVFDGPVTGTAGAVFTSDVVGQGTSLHTHTHGGIVRGSAQTDAPT